MPMFYHVTPSHNLDSIMSHGLQPAIGPRSAELGEEVYRVYLFTSLEACQEALSNWLGEAFEDEAGELIILEVDATGVEGVSEAEYEVASPVAIDPGQIIRVLHESGASINERSMRTAAPTMK